MHSAWPLFPYFYTLCIYVHTYTATGTFPYRKLHVTQCPPHKCLSDVMVQEYTDTLMHSILLSDTPFSHTPSDSLSHNLQQFRHTMRVTHNPTQAHTLKHLDISSHTGPPGVTLAHQHAHHLPQPGPHSQDRYITLLCQAHPTQPQSQAYSPSVTHTHSFSHSLICSD